METRTNYPHIDYRTQLQWAKDGKIVNSDSVGMRMWSNGHRQRSFIYFAPSDVHDGTEVCPKFCVNTAGQCKIEPK